MPDSSRDSDPIAKPRGLWSVISQSSHSETPAAESVPELDSQSEEPASAAPQGLFAIMRRAEVAEEPIVLEPVSPIDRNNKSLVEANDKSPVDEGRNESSVEPDDQPEEVPLPHVDVEEVDSVLPLIDTGDNSRKSSRKAAARRLRQSGIAFLFGLASVGLSALSMRPEVWMSIPAFVCGFFAIFLGYTTLTGARLRKRSSFTTIASQSGMLLGTLGIFLGPLAFAGLGRELRESQGNQQTRKHLGVIGEALNQYHDRHDAYPIGGTFSREATGTFRGQHGWMTFLLPFIGEASLFSQIDQSQPFDAIDNRKAMGHEIEVYYAAGGDRTKIGQGYAVAHFAGLGGDIDDETGVSHAGIFTRDTAIRQVGVTDGLSNTMIVGEVAGNFAPWGDPENWRTIGRGLNKDVNGFGNSTGNGALFLFGDGSVKMFGNKTDPKLLRHLSSRDGGERMP